MPSRRSVGCVLLIAIVFAACGSPSQPADAIAVKQTPPATPPIIARFDCDTLGLTATFHDDQVLIEIPEQRARTLPRVLSGSGVRYSNGSDTFWNKGREATLELSGHTQTCRERQEPWQEAADRGVDFRAVGQEPGWFLEIDKDTQIRFVYDYAEHQVTAPVPAPTVKGASTVYDAMVESHRLIVQIENASCTDAMSGDVFPQSVSITLDSRTLLGCGKDTASER